MSAARALQVVTEAPEDEFGDPTASTESVANQWEPENQLIGALMWLTASQARPLLELVPDAAIWDPMTRWAYQLIRAVVDDHADPNPVAVLQAGRTRCPISAQPDSPPSAGRHHKLAVHLFGAYSATIAPHDMAGQYARMVLDDAYRRAFDTCGQRMQQLSSCEAERGELTTAFAAIRDELADLWRRTETAANPGWWTP